MAKAGGKPARVLVLAASLRLAGENAGFIPVPHFILVQIKAARSQEDLPQFDDSTIRLQWNSKAKMMPCTRIFQSIPS
jgi:hypothetical protein